MKWFWQKENKPSDTQEDLSKKINSIIDNNVTIKQCSCNHANAEIVFKCKHERMHEDFVNGMPPIVRNDRYALKCISCEKVIRESNEGEYLKQEYKKAKDALNGYYAGYVKYTKNNEVMSEVMTVDSCMGDGKIREDTNEREIFGPEPKPCPVFEIK